MTDEQITDTLIELTNSIDWDKVQLGKQRENAYVAILSVVDYINRLKERIDNMHYENQNLQTYIDNHEEIWKHNAEIDKAIVRKETAKEIYGLIDSRRWGGIDNNSDIGGREHNDTINSLCILIKSKFGV